MRGGRDVVGSAARAVPFDRSAVSDKAAIDSVVGFPTAQAKPVLMQEPHVEAEGQGRVREHGREEGSQPRLPSDPAENKADGPSVIAAVINSNSSASVAEPTMPEAVNVPRPAVSGDSLATFHCPVWTRSMGTCCPEGAVRHDCPSLLERRLELAERDLICADYTESTAKMLREKEAARARIASIKRQIAERNAEVSHA
jgi:hypothetical protein